MRDTGYGVRAAGRAALVVGLLCVSGARAGVELGFSLEHPAVLQHERMPARVSIRNTGSTPLVLGGADANIVLDFVVELCVVIATYEGDVVTVVEGVRGEVCVRGEVH